MLNIALVVPCLNDADLLARCLASFRDQTRPLDQIIVVDNGSTDASAAVAASFGALVVREPRRGITWAARAGYDAALADGADLIVRTDADAWAGPTFVEELVRQFALLIDASAQHTITSPVGLTGAATFDLPVGGTLLARLYLGAYRASVGSALGHPPFFGTNCAFFARWWGEVRDAVDSADTFVHDDIQLSFAVRPHETVLYAPQLSVRMDARALRGAAQLRTRFHRGWYSMLRGFQTSPPPRRLLARWAGPREA